MARPLGRVIGTAIFGALLLAAGLWLHTGKASATAGVIALVTTSYLVSALLVYTLVHWLAWWPEPVVAVTLVIIVFRQLNTCQKSAEIPATSASQSAI